MQFILIVFSELQDVVVQQEIGKSDMSDILFHAFPFASIKIHILFSLPITLIYCQNLLVDNV
jgi:hypothetical protein